jgi:hypothetical protein
MHRFYFHLRSGKQLISDEERMDFPDALAARQEALESARHILADAIRFGREDIPEAFVIFDSQGCELATLPFVAVLPKDFEHEILQRKSSTCRRMRARGRPADAAKRR